MDPIYRIMPNGFRVCPYDHSHVVIAVRFIGHLMKCARSSGKKYYICPWNAQHHIVEPDDCETHIASCEDRVHIDLTRSAMAKQQLTVQEYQETLPKPSLPEDKFWKGGMIRDISDENIPHNYNDVSSFSDEDSHDNDFFSNEESVESVSSSSNSNLLGSVPLGLFGRLTSRCSADIYQTQTKSTPVESANTHNASRVVTKQSSRTISPISACKLPNKEIVPIRTGATGQFGDIERVDEELALIVDMFASSSFSKSSKGLAILQTLVQTINEEAQQQPHKNCSDP